MLVSGGIVSRLQICPPNFFAETIKATDGTKRARNIGDSPGVWL